MTDQSGCYGGVHVTDQSGGTWLDYHCGWYSHNAMVTKTEKVFTYTAWWLLWWS